MPKTDELGGSRMEQKSIWKNFLLLIVGSLLALHINVVSAADSTSAVTSTDSDKTEGCSLEEQISDSKDGPPNRWPFFLSNHQPVY